MAFPIGSTAATEQRMRVFPRWWSIYSKRARYWPQLGTYRADGTVYWTIQGLHDVFTFTCTPVYVSNTCMYTFSFAMRTMHAARTTFVICPSTSVRIPGQGTLETKKLAKTCCPLATNPCRQLPVVWFEVSNLWFRQRETKTQKGNVLQTITDRHCFFFNLRFSRDLSSRFGTSETETKIWEGNVSFITVGYCFIFQFEV